MSSSSSSLSERWRGWFGATEDEALRVRERAHEEANDEEEEEVGDDLERAARRHHRKRETAPAPAPAEREKRVRLQIVRDDDAEGDTLSRGAPIVAPPAPAWADDDDDDEADALDDGAWWQEAPAPGGVAEVNDNGGGGGDNEASDDDDNDDVGQVLRFDPERHDEFGAHELGDDDDDDDERSEDEDARDTRLRNEAHALAEQDLLARPTYAAPSSDPNGRPWTRPPVADAWQPPMVPEAGAEGPASDETLLVQHVETTYGIDMGDPERPPVVRLFGLTEQGNSVLVNVRGFRPYFYAHFDSDNEAAFTCNRLEAYLQSKYARSRRHYAPRYVVRMESVNKRSMCGWHRHAPLQRMYKVVMAHPAHVREARNSLEGRNPAVSTRRVVTYEANVPFELRFMVDARLAGCQWFRVPRSQCREAGVEYPDGDVRERTGRAQVEVEADSIDAIRPVDVADKGDLAPMRFLSFDIEAKRGVGRAGFVRADRDPVVLICGGLKAVGVEGVRHKVVFALVDRPDQSVASFADGVLDEKSRDATVYVFHDERALLLAFAQYVRESDPDAFTGWNITNFDWPYLVNRAKALGCDDAFLDITRLRDKRAWLREQTFQSKAYGAKKTNELVCDGRMDYDGLLYFLRGGVMTKFRSYTLNAIAKEILGKQKLDVHYTQIPILHEGTDQMRRDLAEYCLWDALLPLELLDKMMAVVNGIEQSRVTGVSIKWLLSRGQGIKTFSNILRYKDECELVPSRCERNNDVYTVGGYVRDPIAGHYKWPIATLDFASLYPSIMQAHNICYSTVETLAWARAHLQEGDYWVPPTVEGAPPVDFCFVKRHVREGVLPRLLTALLAQRRYVKRLMNDLPDTPANKLLRSVLDGRQNALKVVCNSVYGFLKAFILIDPRLMTAVTSWGQTMIKQVAAIVTRMFENNMIVDRAACEAANIPYERTPAPGEPDPRPRKWYPARIIYGDTDSVMVDFGDIGLQDVVAYAKRASKACTEAMERPNELAFESIKIYSLLMRKKRYGSLEILLEKIRQDGYKRVKGDDGKMVETDEWERGDTIADAVAKAKLSLKGLESKRRDNAPIGSETQKKLLEAILCRNDLAGGVELVKQRIADVLTDRVDMSKFVITKGLSKLEYDTQQQHTWVRQKIIARADRTGEVPPETGDRVPFIMFAGTTKDKSYERSEDPMYALRTGMPIDKSYYVGKQIMSATLRILTCAMEPEALPVLAGPWTRKRIAPLKAFKAVFRTNLPHMRHRVQRRTRGYGIGRHAVPGAQCAQPGCSVKITPQTLSSVVCDDHRREEAQATLQAELDKARTAQEAAWKKCTDCAGGSFDVRRCGNTICDNFYHRHRTVMDVEDLMADLRPFEQPERTAAAAGRPRGVCIDHTQDPEWIAAHAPKPKRKTTRRKKSKAEYYVTKRRPRAADESDDDEAARWEREHEANMALVRAAPAPVSAMQPPAKKAKKPPAATHVDKTQKQLSFAKRPRMQ